MPRTAISKPRVVTRFMVGSTFFNGSSSVVQITNRPIYNLVNYSVSFWLKATPTATDKYIIQQGKNDSSLPFWGIGYYDADAQRFRLRAFVRDDSNNVCSGAGYLTDINLVHGKWYHVVVTDAGGSFKCYVNGVYQGINTTYTRGTLTLNQTAFGAVWSTTVSNYFGGNLSEVKIFNSVLTASQAQELYATGSVSGVTPVASYSLYDQPPTYIDSISGNNGTGIATTYSTDTPVQQRVVVSDDKASLSYSSISTYTDIGTAFSVANRTAFTVCTIVYIGSNANQDIVTQRRSGNGYLGAWRLTVLNNKFEFYGFSTGGGEIFNCVSNLTVVPGRWYTLAAVFDPVALTAKLFINGLLNKSVPVAGTGNFDNTIAIGIGKNFRDGNNPLIGKMAKFYMWNGEALTAQEVADIHFNRKVKSSQFLKCAYEHNEGTGTTLSDSSGNGNHSTITGAAWSSYTPSKNKISVGSQYIPNPYMDDDDGTGKPAGWTSYQSGDGDTVFTRSIDRVNYVTGTGSHKVTVYAPSGTYRNHWTLISIPGILPTNFIRNGNTIRVFVRFKTSVGTYAYIGFSDATTARKVAETSPTVWTEVTTDVVFAKSVTSLDLQIQCKNTNTTNTATLWIDEIRITHIPRVTV